MQKSAIIKALGVAAAVIGFGANLVSSWVGDKQVDDKIEAKVSKAIAEQLSKGKE